MTRLGTLVKDVPVQRAQLSAIVDSTWGACTRPDPDKEGAPPFRVRLLLLLAPLILYGASPCVKIYSIQGKEPTYPSRSWLNI